MNSNKPYIVGITGGIGAGKSTVTDILKGIGFTIIDADEVSREITQPGAPALEALKKAFGEGIISTDGTLDRTGLAEVAFATKESTEKLNGIMHGAIAQRVKEHTEDAALEGKKVIFYSAALMYETGAEKSCDEVWLITADDETRIKRAAKRDRTSPAKIAERMSKQMPEGEKIKRADYIIVNTGSKEDLEFSLRGALEALAATLP
jgi:dephospho-CoA kinase